MKHITRQGFIKALTLAAGALISLPLISKGAQHKTKGRIRAHGSPPPAYPEIRYSEYLVPRMANVTCMMAATVIRGEHRQMSTYTDESTPKARAFFRDQAEANFKAVATHP
jgi:hypothetical protein